MSQDTVHIIVDGAEVSAKSGQSILEAADAVGIYIPRLCHHPGLPPGGHCRICTVKVNGKPSSSCTFPVAEGLVIENNTDDLNEQRRRLVEMLFVEGNHYCPTCEASGNCELQALGYRLGLLAPSLPYFREKRELDASHPDIYIDRDRCVMCGRCVRASNVVDGKKAFGFEERGAKMRLAVDAVDGLAETAVSADDKAPQVCPTGCLTIKRRGYATPVGRRKFDHEPIGAEIEKKHAAV